MQYISLNDSHQLPIMGFGTYMLKGRQAIEAVAHALDNGYRLIDTASKYLNEKEVGEGIKQSGIPRAEIKLTTKLWRDSLGYDAALREFDKSLANLGVDYLDLYLIHWPANSKNYNNWQKANAGAWKALEYLKEQGVVKSIGVSNFWEEHLKALFVTAHIPPSVNQIEFHPGYWQEKEMRYSQNQGIAVQSWSPLARGKVLDHPLLIQIAQKYQKTVSQICLRWVIQHQVIVIPKAQSLSRIQENSAIFDFELTEQEMEQINQIPLMGYSGEHPNHWPDRITL